MKQTFAFNDGSKPTLNVLGQLTYKYDAMTIQISKVKVENEVKFVYEEVTNDTDEIKYARYMDQSNIRRNYPWAVTLLPLSPLTKKQEQVLRCVKNFGLQSNDEMIPVEEFKAATEEVLAITPKAIEGILSSLWVKGCIEMTVLAGPGTRFFTLDTFGIEYLKDAEPAEVVEREDDEDEQEEE